MLKKILLLGAPGLLVAILEINSLQAQSPIGPVILALALLPLGARLLWFQLPSA